MPAASSGTSRAGFSRLVSSRQLWCAVWPPGSAAAHTPRNLRDAAASTLFLQ